MRDHHCAETGTHLPHQLNAVFQCPGVEPSEPEAIRPAELRIYEAFSKERVRAHDKHRATSQEQQDVLADRRVSILAEELGEAARALNDLRHAMDHWSMTLDGDERQDVVDVVAHARKHLRTELIQLGAMATCWIANLDEDRLDALPPRPQGLTDISVAYDFEKIRTGIAHELGLDDPPPPGVPPTPRLLVVPPAPAPNCGQVDAEGRTCVQLAGHPAEVLHDFRDLGTVIP